MLFFPLQPKAVAGIHPNRVGYPNFKQHGCHLSDAHAAQSGDVRKVLGSWRQRLVDPALLIGQVFYRQTAACSSCRLFFFRLRRMWSIVGSGRLFLLPDINRFDWRTWIFAGKLLQ